MSGIMNINNQFSLDDIPESSPTISTEANIPIQAHFQDIPYHPVLGDTLIDLKAIRDSLVKNKTICKDTVRRIKSISPILTYSNEGFYTNLPSSTGYRQALEDIENAVSEEELYTQDGLIKVIDNFILESTDIPANLSKINIYMEQENQLREKILNIYKNKVNEDINNNEETIIPYIVTTADELSTDIEYILSESYVGDGKVEIHTQLKNTDLIEFLNDKDVYPNIKKLLTCLIESTKPIRQRLISFRDGDKHQSDIEVYINLVNSLARGKQNITGIVSRYKELMLNVPH